MADMCSDTQMRLPWLLNGTLSSEETVETLNHVKACSACKSELVFLAKTQQAAVIAWSEAPAPVFHDELWARIQVETTKRTMQAPSASNWFHVLIETVGHAVSPLGMAAGAVRVAYRSLLLEFRHVFNI